MKAFLMYKNQDFNLNYNLSLNEKILCDDLELNILFNAMSNDDDFIFDVSKKAVLQSLNGSDTIFYRQNILKDCLKNVDIIKSMYDISVNSIEGEKKTYYGIFSEYPDANS